jgi:hypothetical protein
MNLRTHGYTYTGTGGLAMCMHMCIIIMPC